MPYKNVRRLAPRHSTYESPGFMSHEEWSKRGKREYKRSQLNSIFKKLEEEDAKKLAAWRKAEIERIALMFPVEDQSQHQRTQESKREA